jgi:hypothetical protein
LSRAGFEGLQVEAGAVQGHGQIGGGFGGLRVVCEALFGRVEDDVTLESILLICFGHTRRTNLKSV